MKREILGSILLFSVITSCSNPNKTKINPYEFNAPEDIQKHFNHKIKWDAVRQERWKNGFLWVDSIGNDKIIVIHHEKV
jgi:hypothetical protein